MTMVLSEGRFEVRRGKVTPNRSVTVYLLRHASNKADIVVAIFFEILQVERLKRKNDEEIYKKTAR